MYFVDHNKLENEVSDGNSKVNDHEASFLVEFCRYLIKQEYKPSQITILTTYSGQLFAFKKKMPKEEFEGRSVHGGQLPGGGEQHHPLVTRSQ